MAKDRLNFCVFGAGRIGKLHARNLAAHPRARVSCIVDPISRAAADLARDIGAAAAPDAATALADREIDAVVVASSTNTHVDLIVASARAGKAVLCEKPMTTTVDEARQMVALAKSKNAINAVQHNLRYYPVLQQLRHSPEEPITAIGALSQKMFIGATRAEFRASTGAAGPSRSRRRHGMNRARFGQPKARPG